MDSTRKYLVRRIVEASAAQNFCQRLWYLLNTTRRCTKQIIVVIIESDLLVDRVHTIAVHRHVTAWWKYCLVHSRHIVCQCQREDCQKQSHNPHLSTSCTTVLWHRKFARAFSLLKMAFNTYNRLESVIIGNTRRRPSPVSRLTCGLPIIYRNIHEDFLDINEMNEMYTRAYSKLFELIL